MKPETEIDETRPLLETFRLGDICSNMGAMCSRVARSHMVSVPESAIGNRHAFV